MDEKGKETIDGGQTEPMQEIMKENTIYVGSQEVPKKKGNGLKKFWAVVLIIVLSLGSGFGGAMVAIYFAPQLLPRDTIENKIQINTQSNINTAEAVAEKVIPSVVGISTKINEPFNSFFGVQNRERTGIGTGLIISKDGYILTNSHVVMDGETTNIMVQLADGREIEGRVLWNDATIDLAVVKIEENNLVAAELGDSEEVRIGSYAVAIGNPLGLAFDRSVTQGVISGLGRSITVAGGQSARGVTIDDLMQTDASINSGNSGGPLCNSAGQVIGINTAKAQTGEGLGFAIPINTAKPIVEEIIEKGEFKRAYLGIRGISVEELVATFPDQKFDAKKGVFISQIYTGSPAAAAGMKEGDIIMGINDKDVETMSQMIKDLFSYRPGDEVSVKILRDGKVEVLKVTLSDMVE